MNNSLIAGRQKFIKIDRLRALLRNRETGVQIYLLAFLFFLFSEAMSTTMFAIPDMVYTLCKGIAILLVLVKLVLFGEYSGREFWAMVICLLFGAAVFASSGYTEAFTWILMVFGAKDVPLRKILKIYLIVSVCIVLMAFLASMIGVIENLQYTREDDIRKMRNSFGVLYTTDFASHIFAIILVSFYLLKQRLKLVHYAIAVALACLVYRFCNTRLDVICMFLAVGVFLAINIVKQRIPLIRKYKRCSAIGHLAKWIMPILALLMIAASYLYRNTSSIMVKADLILSNRLALGRRALDLYSLLPFGQYVKMNGYGGTTAPLLDYFFVDCSYLYVALRYGILILLSALAVYVLIVHRYKMDAYMVGVILILAVNCMIAHHLMELAYNPFPLALFAGAPWLVDLKQKKKGKYEGADHWHEDPVS